MWHTFVITQYTAAEVPYRHDFCGPDDVYCLDQASVVWLDIQDAAEEYYDRTSACTFTSFVGYEWTRAPLAANLHRNVVFRNEVVPPMPTSGVEEPTPQGLWAALQSQCLDGLLGCDVLAIPHNPNLSDGQMFLPENADGTPLTAADAVFRAKMEPLIEIYQHKGDSECRTGVLTNDELCGFEKKTGVLLGIPPGGGMTYDPRLFVRNILKEGLELEQSLGANPFRLGLIGATDSHNSTPGMVNEEDFGTAGHLGTRDATPEFILTPPTWAILGGIEASAGGLAVVWAEENSRDALFSAMRRREVYGTSGKRPVVLPPDCAVGDAAAPRGLPVRLCTPASHLRSRLDLLPGGRGVREGIACEAKPHRVPESVAKSCGGTLDRKSTARVA